MIIRNFIGVALNFKIKNKAMILPDETILSFNKDTEGGDL